MAKFTQEDIRLAQETERKYGVPASVTLAQYALESGYGTSGLAQRANNYFGISGKNVSTGAYVTSGGRRWAKYSTKAESFDDHGRLLSTDLYASKTAGATNVSEYVDAIAETYAPSSDGNNGYATKLKQIISQNNLTQYDVGRGGGFASSYGGSFGGSVGGNAVVGTTATTTTTTNTQMTAFEQDMTLIGKIVKFVVLVLIGLLAAVFFFVAFDIPLDPKKMLLDMAGDKVNELLE